MLNSNLPELCYSVSLLDENEVIIIKQGEMGYYRPSLNGGYKGNENFTGRQYANELNERLGVTKAQEEAMVAGSMFGWDVPGANPEMYEKENQE